MAADWAGEAHRAGFATVSPGWGAAVAETLLTASRWRHRPGALILALTGEREAGGRAGLRAVPGVGGSLDTGQTTSRADVERLLRRCAPPHLRTVTGPATPVVRDGRPLRAVVSGETVRCWTSARTSWRPDGDVRASFALSCRDCPPIAG
jgi:hypothetical protein